MSDLAGTPRPPWTITSAAAALAGGTTTAVDVVTEALRRTDRWDTELGAFVHRTDDAALEQAAQVDVDRARGRAVGPLAGIPVGIKDIIDARGSPTTAQSDAHDAEIATHDAAAVARLRAAGAIVTGKTSTMEYAIGLPEQGGSFRTPRNPWDPAHWSGGSSSGTAIGVATGMVLGGLGTDTAGSIRNPAAWCGVTGLKPTYGLVPATGVIPLAYTYDHVGPIARTAQDCALMLDVLIGVDQGGQRATRPMPIRTDDGLTGLRLGFSRLRLMDEDADPQVAGLFDDALNVFADNGADLREVTLPLVDVGHDATMVGLAVEAFTFHRQHLVARWGDYGRSSRLAIAAGALVSGADYLQAQRVRRELQHRLRRLFTEVDVVLTPTTTRTAPRLDEMDFAAVVRSLTTPYWNASGYPAVSVPMGVTAKGLPAGLQICARPFEDLTALGAAAAFQDLTDHHSCTSTRTGG